MFVGKKKEVFFGVEDMEPKIPWRSQAAAARSRLFRWPALDPQDLHVGSPG